MERRSQYTIRHGGNPFETRRPNTTLIMTTRVELLEIIANGENSGIEFKRDDARDHDLAKDLVAFSNLEGGRVFLGVDDDGTVVGVTRERLEEWVADVCRDKIMPAVTPYFETIKDARPGADVVVVRVPRGVYAHSQRSDDGNVYFVRVGTRSRESTPEELDWLFRRRGALRADLRPAHGTTLDDLDRRRLKEYFQVIRQQEIPDDDDESSWRTLLVNTGIMVEDGVGWSGLLLFGSMPNRFLPQAGIDAAAFSGSEKDYAAIERRKLRGPMTSLSDRGGELLEAGLVEQALEFVRRNTPVSGDLKDSARRVGHSTYPDEVVREAVTNALIHRDYLLANTDIELAVYQDRLEVISPGRLPNGITPERMRVGARAAQDPLLKDVMRDYGYVEHMGMGVPRKIVRGMRLRNGTEADLIEDGERFIVRLFA